MKRELDFMPEIDGDGDLLPYDRHALQQALLDLEGTLAQIGGIVTIAAVRQQHGTEGVTVGVKVVYDSFSPFANKRRPEPTVPPEAVEPVDVTAADEAWDDDDEDAPVAPVGAEG